MLNRKFNQKKIVDDRERKNRGIQKRNQEKSGRAQNTRKRHNLLFPPFQKSHQVSAKQVAQASACVFFPSTPIKKALSSPTNVRKLTVKKASNPIPQESRT